MRRKSFQDHTLVIGMAGTCISEKALGILNLVLYYIMLYNAAEFCDGVFPVYNDLFIDLPYMVYVSLCLGTGLAFFTCARIGC